MSLPSQTGDITPGNSYVAWTISNPTTETNDPSFFRIYYESTTSSEIVVVEIIGKPNTNNDASTVTAVDENGTTISATPFVYDYEIGFTSFEAKVCENSLVITADGSEITTATSPILATSDRFRIEYSGASALPIEIYPNDSCGSSSEEPDTSSSEPQASASSESSTASQSSTSSTGSSSVNSSGVVKSSGKLSKSEQTRIIIITVLIALATISAAAGVVMAVKLIGSMKKR
jgi:hypothetical protein